MRLCGAHPRRRLSGLSALLRRSLQWVRSKPEQAIRLEAHGGLAGVQAIMLLARVALATYPRRGGGRGNATAWLMNVP